MKLWRGLYLPDSEEHLIDWMSKVNKVVNGKPTYQYHKLEASVKYCKNRRNAIDIGAHCGLWSMHLTKLFERVHAFEPMTAHRECFNNNVVDTNVVLYPVALGDKEGWVSLTTGPNSSGDTWVIPETDSTSKVVESINMVTLDSLNLQEVDFIKIDCEGYEYPILKGAVETITSWYPTICVEQKPNHGVRFGLDDKEAVSFLETLGYAVVQEISGDFIMVYDGPR